MLRLFLFISLSCSDVDKIHDGIGDKVGLLIQWLATFVGGFIVAFVSEWRLTLLLLAFSPLLALAGFMMARVSNSLLDFLSSAGSGMIVSIYKMVACPL